MTVGALSENDLGLGSMPENKTVEIYPGLINCVCQGSPENQNQWNAFFFREAQSALHVFY